MLAFSRKLNTFIRLQIEGKWQKLQCDELAGKRLGIVGLGSVGMEVARKAKCFGMTVTASKRTPSSRPAYVDELLPHTELSGLFGRSDFGHIGPTYTRDTSPDWRERAAADEKGSRSNQHK